MAKDTSTSKCPEMESGCKNFCSVNTEKFICNDGFVLRFSVVTSGFLLNKEDITAIGRSCSSLIGECIKEFRSEPDADGQLVFGF